MIKLTEKLGGKVRKISKYVKFRNKRGRKYEKKLKSNRELIHEV